VSGDPMIGNSSPAIPLSPRKFIDLYRIVPVSVEQSTKRTEQPSPPKVTEIITYSVK